MTPAHRPPAPQSPSTRPPSSQAKVPDGGTAAVFAGSIPLPPNAQLLDRIRGEYLDMPGLKLTLPQAQRLWHLGERECEALLGALIDAKFLCRHSDGQFARVSELGSIDRHRPVGRVAKAQLELRAYQTTREAAS